MSQAQTLTVLNNSRRKGLLGSPVTGQQLTFYPGATCVPTPLFAAVHDAQDLQGSTLREYPKAGTLCKIEDAAPLAAEKISEMKPEQLIAAAAKHGDPETRARLAQRAHKLLTHPEHKVPHDARAYFEPLNALALDSNEINPHDLEHGWKLWLGAYEQKHADPLMQCFAADLRTAREHSET